MNAFKKAIFTLLTFLVVFGGFPVETFAIKGYGPHCGKWIDESNDGDIVIPNDSIFQNDDFDPENPLAADGSDIPGGLRLDEAVEFYAEGSNRKGDVEAYKVNCDSSGEAISIEYKIEHDGFTLAGEKYSYGTQDLNSSGYATGDSSNTGKINITSSEDNTVSGEIKKAVSESFDDLGTKVKALAQDALGFVLAGLAIILTWVNYIMIGISGALFEASLSQAVAQLGDFIGSGSPTGESIEQAWILFKNLANLLFIFLILFVAIKTILRGNGFGDKRLLGGIIVVALLMNFSLLFTRTLINISNSLSISIYNAITYDETNNIRKSIGVTLVSHLKLTTFSDSGLPKTMAEMGDDFSSNSLQFIMAVFATPLFLITALGLLFTAGTLILRLISFIFLMIFSPIAFVAAIIPGMKGFWQKWLNSLVSNSLSLPVLLIALYLTLILAEGLESSLLKAGASFAGLYEVLGQVWGAGTSSEQVMSNSLEVIVGVTALIINYAIIMTSLFFAFWGSRKVGITGASWATAVADTKTKVIKYGLKPAQGGVRATGRGATKAGRVAGGTVLKAGGAVTGTIGQNTLGRLGSGVANNRATQNLASKNGILGALARRVEGGENAVAGATFGEATGGFSGKGARRDAEAARLLGLRKKLGSARVGKEQKIKNRHDQAKAEYDHALKGRKEIEKNLKDKQQEELGLVNEFLGAGVGASHKTNFQNANAEVKRLEKLKRKQGSLSAADMSALSVVKTTLESEKNAIIADARASSVVSGEKKKIVTNVQGAITGLSGKLPDAQKKESQANAAWIDTQADYKGVKDAIDKRVEKFDKNVNDKTLTVTSQIMKSDIAKLTVAGAGLMTIGAVPTLAVGAAAGVRAIQQKVAPTTKRAGMNEYSSRVAAGKTDAPSSGKGGGKKAA